MVCPKCKTATPDHLTECPVCAAEFDESGLFTRVPRGPKLPGPETQPPHPEGSKRIQGPSKPAPTQVEADQRTVVLGGGASIGEKTPPDELDAGPTRPGTPNWSTFLSPLENTDGALCLMPGIILAGRYQILHSLGEGGMGTVYKAHDLEVERLVAIKVIRPELASDLQILRRFKQELILARQVTHRNVVRIYDLGVTDNLKFISMEFIDGRELTALLEDSGKLEPKQAAEIMLQVCRGLEAAHAEGVIHRDLKPQNIMIDGQGRVAVMDFGVAHYMRGELSPTITDTAPDQGHPGLTQVGALLGTPRYMSPEQAKSEPVDARSDLFTVGIIFYELLTGVTPFSASTRKESLRKRIEETVKPPIELDPQIPKPLNQIVVKCLQRDPSDRYESATALIHELEVWLGIATSLRPGQIGRMRWIAAALALLLVVAFGFITWNQMRSGSTAPHAPVKLLLSDFANRTGQPVLDGTLQPIIQDALERASFITVFNRGAARKLAAQLKPHQNQMDESLARLVALREGVGIVVSGQIEKHGSGYRLLAKALNASKGDTILSSRADASNTAELPQAVEKLAARIRKSLGDASGTPKNLAAETFTSASLDAAQHYSEAQELQWAGKWDQSVAAYRQAVQLDPNFSRAYSGLAATLANLGQRAEAQKYYQLALAHVDRMSEREKYRTRGGYYLLTRDYQKATEQFRALVNQYPADTAGIANLGFAYFYARNMSAALAEGQRAVDLYPNNLLQRNNVGLYAMYAGDFDRAIRESESILKVNPSFEKAYLCLAMSYLGKGDEANAKAAYEKLSQLSPWGASEAALGRADLDIYSGDLKAAQVLLEKGIQQDIAAGNKSAAALKQIVLASAQIGGRNQAAALDNAGQAAQANDDESVLYPAAHVYLEAGQPAKALQIAAKLGSRFGPEPRSMAKLIEGEVALKARKFADALTSFQEAQKLADSWLGRYDLGRAYLEAGVFPDADNEFDVCLRRRGEATAVFLDDEPSLRYLPPVYYYQGRASEGLHSPGAEEMYKTFLGIRHSNEPDPLVADAKRRVK